MTFRHAVEATPSVARGFRPGLGALKKPDRDRVSIADPRNLTGSVSLDSTLSSLLPNSPRWDYGIGWKRRPEPTGKVSWVEVHPATGTDDIDTVLDKLVWLKDWLRGDGARLASIDREFVWVSSGKTYFTKTAPQLRRLAEKAYPVVPGSAGMGLVAAA